MTACMVGLQYCVWVCCGGDFQTTVPKFTGLAATSHGSSRGATALVLPVSSQVVVENGQRSTGISECFQNSTIPTNAVFGVMLSCLAFMRTKRYVVEFVP